MKEKIEYLREKLLEKRRWSNSDYKLFAALSRWLKDNRQVQEKTI